MCTGTAALLQTIGVRRIRSFAGVDPRLLWQLVRSVPYVAGLTCNGASFGLSLLALRSLPLFVVQAIVAANLAVIAILATVVLGARLRMGEWLAVAAVIAGVVLLIVSASPAPADQLAWAGRWALFGFTLVLGAVSFVLGRSLHHAGMIGLLAGLAFGSNAFAARVIGTVDLGAAWQLLADPAAYALVLGGVLGPLLYATALQRGSVTVASAMAIVGQTLGPALAGRLLLGGHTHLGLAAYAGFVVTVVGAVALARHACPESVLAGRRASGLAPGEAERPKVRV